MSDSVSREAVLRAIEVHTLGQSWSVVRNLRTRIHALPAVEPDPVTEAAVALKWLDIAARDVCSLCSGSAFPLDPSCHAIHGPNAAGNYTHSVNGEDRLCPATSIHAHRRWIAAKEATDAAVHRERSEP